MNEFDKVSTASFYVSFACLLSGITLGAFLSPLLRVEKQENVLLVYTFRYAFDAPSSTVTLLKKIDAQCAHSQEMVPLKDIPSSV